MIDTHCHLNLPLFEEKLEETVNAAKAAGIKAIIIASTSLADSQQAIVQTKKYPEFLWASIGIHPQKTDPENKMPISEQLSNLIVLARNNKNEVKAMGECGMDPTSAGPNEETRTTNEQRELFLGQMEIAVQLSLPLIIHSRSANDEIIEIIKEFPGAQKLKGVFHCYSGGKKRTRKILDLPGPPASLREALRAGQWYFGIDGNITYTPEIAVAAEIMPRERVVLETDSPWLAPLPFRKQTNSPANLVLIVRKMAEIWNISFEQAGNITTQNAKTLFNL